jgi:hypothetical protein
MDREMVPTDQDENLPRIDICWLYLFFLSARHLHFPAAVFILLASSIGLFMLSMITGTSYTTAVFFPQLAVVFLEIAWFCCFRPAVVVSVKSRKNRFLPGIGTIRVYPSSSPKNGKIIMEGKEISMILPAVYVAHTGYFDKRGFPLYGLYAGAKILKGSVFPKGCSLIQVSLLY